MFTVIILIGLEIISTTFFPAIGLKNFRPSFNILIILYIGFRLESPFVAFLILVVQYTHSFFSIEGWALGTVSGVIVCMIISYLRELIHFSTKLLTIVVVQIFQMAWFIITSILLYFRTSEWDYILEKLIRFIPESILISIIAPYCFLLLDRVWSGRGGAVLGDRN